MTEVQNVYPIYLVHDINSGYPSETSEPFTVADMEFRGKSTKLKPTDHRISFRAYSDADRFILQLSYERVPREADGEIALIFDRKHSHRTRHNAVTFKISPEGSLSYEEFLYELEVGKPIPQGVEFDWTTNEGMCNATLTIPLAFLLLASPEQRVLGFNVIRSLKQEGGIVLLNWSGIPGERPLTGYGAGDLLLTRGLTPQEIGEWSNKTVKETNRWYCKWEKWDIPQELHGFVKEKRRGYTVRLDKTDVEKARANAEHTPWGRRIKEEILNIADYWSAKSDDELFDLVPVGNPRALSVGQYFGDPLHGGKRTAYQVCLERPYQYYNPVTKQWWHNGMTIYNPTTGEPIVLEDDGSGFLAPEGFPNPGVRYMFTASYRLFLFSMLMGNPYCVVLEDTTVCPETTGERNSGAINYLAYAYLLTGDKSYARKALILIGRIAELIPFMNGNYGSGYYDTVQISEPTTTETHWLSNYFEAADLLHEVSQELDPELQRFFAGKPDAENRVRNAPFCVRTAVRDMIPYLLFSAEIEKTRTADWSLRWIYLELIIASYMESGKLMRHILYDCPYSLESKFRNQFFRDGRYTYDSVGYILHNCEYLAVMPNNTYRFRDEEEFPQGVDLFDNPDFGFHKVIEVFANLLSGALKPMFGDTLADNFEPISEGRRKGEIVYSPSFEIAYRRAPGLRPLIGELLSRYDSAELEDNRVRSIRETKSKHIFLLLATAAEWEEYRTYAENDVRMQPSFLLEDSETSILRSGTNPHNCKHVVLYGQPTAGHGHGDKLGLWIGAYGYHLLAPAGGYPFTWLSPKYQTWETHSAACTVVLVDGKDQQISYSRLKSHYQGSLLQLSGMENTIANPGTHGERWCWLVQAPNPEDAYVVDLNYIAGGNTFDYNTVGLDCPPERLRFEGIGDSEWVPLEGTLAGADVPLYSKPGYGWMKAVRKARTDEPISWTFPYGGASLKLHTVPAGKQREILCALGEKGGQEMGKSRWEPFVLWRDESDDAAGHAAVFATILEPFENRPFLRSVMPLKPVNPQSEAALSRFQPTGIEIAHQDGLHRDILISCYEEGETVHFLDSAGTSFETDARALLLRYAGDRLLHAEAIGYTRIVAGDRKWEAPGPYKGKVATVDVDGRRIQIELERADDGLKEAWSGQAALIDSPDYVKPSSYLLGDPQLDGLRLTFRSDMTLIKMEEGWPAPQKRLGLGDKQVIEYRGKRVHVDIKQGDEFSLANTLAFRGDRI